LGVAILLDFRKGGRRAAAATIACIVLTALPFLTIQVIHNIRTTGAWRQFASDLWVKQHYPASMLGFAGFDPATRPQPALPQKRALLDTFVVPAYERHRNVSVLTVWREERLPYLLRMAMPYTILVALLPVGLMALRGAERWVLWTTLPLFVIGYAFYVFFLAQYAIVVTPAIILMLILGMREAAQLAGPRFEPALSIGLTAFIVALCVTALPEVDRNERDQFYVAPTIKLVHDQLPAMVEPPAVVLFRWDPAANPHEEPVYNIDVAWPDDAPIIMAHDLGERNIEIIRYYADQQPDRTFYLYDRKDDTIARLGTARDLAR
jgi:hypothetical protein